MKFKKSEITTHMIQQPSGCNEIKISERPDGSFVVRNYIFSKNHNSPGSISKHLRDMADMIDTAFTEK